MKLTQQQRDELQRTFNLHPGDAGSSLAAVLDRMDAILGSVPGLPEWRDPVLDPPSCGDLDADGEVAVKAKDGSVFCTDISGVQREGLQWMCLVELASLPRKDYSELKLMEERRRFEAAFQGNFSHNSGSYVDSRTESAWQGWKLRASAE